jgi:hypothetical protein
MSGFLLRSVYFFACVMCFVGGASFLAMEASVLSATSTGPFAPPFLSPKNLSFKQGRTELSIGFESEVGFFYDWALYASFGLEGQIMRMSKLVFPISLSTEGFSPDHRWQGVCELAPMYDSVRKEFQEEKIYLVDHGVPCDGAMVYRDWYKNLGSRLYFLGDAPVIQAFLAYETPMNRFSVGRMKNLVGFDDARMPWLDDAKMAPLGFWLSKDLLTGASYRFSLPWLQADVGVFSGHNPLKSGASYLHVNGVQTPNIKANNTPTYSGHLKLKGSWSNVEASVGGGCQWLIAGSTWRDVLQDGKRNAHVGTVEADFLWTMPNDNWMRSLFVFAQGTCFESGLRTKTPSARKTTSCCSFTMRDSLSRVICWNKATPPPTSSPTMASASATSSKANPGNPLVRRPVPILPQRHL